MDFVNVEFGNTPVIHEFNQLMQFVRAKPEMIQGYIKGVVRIGVFLLDPLNEHGRFTDTALSSDSDNPGVPIDFGMEVTLEIKVDL